MIRHLEVDASRNSGLFVFVPLAAFLVLVQLLRLSGLRVCQLFVHLIQELLV